MADVSYRRMQLSPNRWPHFNDVSRCSPVISHESRHIGHVDPSSSSSGTTFKGVARLGVPFGVPSLFL